MGPSLPKITVYPKSAKCGFEHMATASVQYCFRRNMVEVIIRIKCHILECSVCYKYFNSEISNSISLFQLISEILIWSAVIPFICKQLLFSLLSPGQRVLLSCEHLSVCLSF